MTDSSIRFIVRADDAGSCRSANRAVARCLAAGVVRNASVMFAGPSAAEIAEDLRGTPDFDLGLHVTLNAEWSDVKWGPVAPIDQVRSLVDENGHFLPTPHDLHKRGFSLDEAVVEVAAQLRRARTLGLRVTYLDEHMGVGWVHGLGGRLAEFARREGLLVVGGVPGLPRDPGTGGGALESLRRRLSAAPPGACLSVYHPGADAPDMRAFSHAGLEPGQVARERDAETRLLCDPALPVMLRDAGVAVCRYSDVLTP